MAHLPVVGGDLNAWGTVLNEYLRVAHNEDGTLKNDPGVVNAKAYGALGNNVQDDSTYLQAAIDAAAANATIQNAGGGRVLIPAGRYKITQTLRLSGVTLIGAGCSIGTDSNGNSNEVTMLQLEANTDLIEIYRGGAGIRDIALVQGTGATGNAITATSDGVHQSPGRVYLNNMQFTGAQGFQKNLYVDGTLSANGARQWFFTNVMFFGAQQAGLNIHVKKPCNWFFNGCQVIQAPAAVTQGITIEDAFTSNFFWNGHVLGDVTTAAAGNNVAGQIATHFTGAIQGNVTCSSGAKNNVFRVYMSGTWSNSGDGSNVNDMVAVAARVSLTAASTQATVNATRLAVAWDVEDFDVYNMHDPANNTRLTAVRAGKYRIYAAVVFAASATGARRVQIRKNAGNYFAGAAIAPNPTGAEDSVVNIATTLDMAVGDYVECYAYQVSGGALNLKASETLGTPSHFGMEMVAAA